MSYVIEARRAPPEPTMVFLAAVFSYVVLLSAATLLNSGVLKALSYAWALAIFVGLIVVAAFLPKLRYDRLGFGQSLGIYYFGLVGSVALNFGGLAVSDLLKMLMGPIFLLIGMAFEARQSSAVWQHKAIRQGFWCMVLLPLGVGVVQLALGQVSSAGGREGALFGGGEFSIFSNRNNAALYTVALLSLYSVLSGKVVRSFAVVLGAAAVFGTLGVVAAALVALALTVVRRSTLKYAVAVLGIYAVGYYFFPDLLVYRRVVPVVESVKLMWSDRINIATVTYGDLVILLQTSDLSFLFRLKHWLNLLDIWAQGSWYQWLFGFGAGSSLVLSKIHLAPHNDYLRFLFECGLVTLAGFLSTIFLIIYYAGRRWEAVPLLTISFYLFSENLINNYLAMALFYFCAGALTLRMRKQNVYSKNLPQPDRRGPVGRSDTGIGRHDRQVPADL